MVLLEKYIPRTLMFCAVLLLGLTVLAAKPARASYLAWSLATDGGEFDITAPSAEAEEKEASEEAAKEDAEAKLDARAKSLMVTPGKVPGTTTQSAEKVVYLTFDDGPSANTQKILDILNKYHIKATFFVTDQNPQYDGLIKKAYEQGNTIGLHSSSHQYSIYQSEQTYFDDLAKIAATVKKEIGFVPAFVRFPGGSSNTVSRKYAPGIMTKLAADLAARGYQYCDWNADSTDGALTNGDPAVIAAHALACGDNNIVLLCHDTAAKGTTVTALPAIIEGYQKRGYTFRAITRDSFVPHHQINN